MSRLVFFGLTPEDFHVDNQEEGQVEENVGQEESLLEVDPDASPGHQVEGHSEIGHCEG